MKQLLGNLFQALQNQPLALALVVINLLYVTSSMLTLREISQSSQRRDALLASCLTNVR